MPQLGNLLKSLATKAGIKLEDETLKKILANQELSTMEVPDDFSQALEGNLLTESSAINNPGVRNKIIRESLNAVDAEAHNFLDQFEFDEATKSKIKTETNSYEKLRLIKENTKKLVQAKTGDKKEDAALQKEIERLNGAAAKIKSDMESKIQQMEATHQSKLIDLNLQSSLAAKPLPKNGLPPEVNILTAKTLIQSEMAKHGLKVQFDEAGNPTIKQLKDGAELVYHVDNKPVGYADFIDGVLAQNKFLQVADPTPTPGMGNTPAAHTPNAPTNASVVASVDAQLASLGMKV